MKEISNKTYLHGLRILGGREFALQTSAHFCTVSAHNISEKAKNISIRNGVFIQQKNPFS